MSLSTCATCAWETQNNTRISPSHLVSNVEWGRRIGVTEASIRRHLQHARPIPVFTETPEDEFLANLGVPEEIVTQRGASVRDPETGSWQKVTWLPGKKALLDTLKYDDLREALDGWNPGAIPFINRLGHTAILNASDLQIGKAMQRGGGTPETVARVRQSFEAFRDHVITSQPSAIVLVDGGDPIENCFNVPSQLVTNDLAVPEQIRVFRRLMLEGIKLLAPLVSDFTYLAVPSNHGAHRTGYKSPGGTVDADFGLEISYQLEDICAESEHLDHVKFVRPESLNETAVIETADTRIAFHHGHQSAGPNGQSKWWAGQDHGRMAGWDADILVTAHYHSLRLEQSGDGRWIIGVSSSDASSDWFTNRTGESALQGMTAFDVKDGQWSNLAIL